MTLVTWQAIGAVILIVVIALLVLFHYSATRLAKDDSGAQAYGCAVTFFWFIVLCVIVAFTWQIIGVGLFGVTR